jgi:ABC-type transport system involved in multi-copper enzyme maturation permease subunit
VRCIPYIAFNTFREAVRDRVLYNLILFAVLLAASGLLFGEISVGVERIVLINLGMAAISLFGILIAIFIGIGLVSKEIEKRTLYTVLSRPVRRWEFIVGKFCGLVGTLLVNAFFMTLGFFAALFYLARGFQRADAWLLVAIWFIVLQFIIVTALALLFSSFSTPLESAVFSFVLFVVGSFADDLRRFAAAVHGIAHVAATFAAYVMPDFAALNVISQVAHGQSISKSLALYNTAYALLYAVAAIAGAVLIFERRNLK